MSLLPPSSAVRPLRRSARPPHAPRPPCSARSRSATLVFEPARDRCPQCRVSSPPSIPIGSLSRVRATSRAGHVSLIHATRAAAPAPAHSSIHPWPPPQLQSGTCARTPTTAATSRFDWLQEHSAVRTRENENARARPSGSAGDWEWGIGVLRRSQKWGNGPRVFPFPVSDLLFLMYPSRNL